MSVLPHAAERKPNPLFSLARCPHHVSPAAWRWVMLMAALLLCCSVPGKVWAQISNPTEIPNLVLWVDASDVNGNGTQPANAAKITTWKDKSGKGHHLTASTGNEPTFETSGFNGVNPSLRFGVGKKMGHSNMFGVSFLDEMTIFFVQANITVTSNVFITLNGDTQDTSETTGRFSFHSPWSNGLLYFDGGGCCNNRIYGTYPTPITGPNAVIVSAQNDKTGSKQFIRADGAVLVSDNTAISPPVSGGFRVGSTSGRNYDGRVAEVAIYDRALTTSEIQSVECYLLAKWAQSKNSTCVSSLSVTKSAVPWSGNNQQFDLPGNAVIYDLQVTKSPGNDVEDETVIIIDSLPSQMVFYNGDPDDGGPLTDPVSFINNNSNLTWNYSSDVRYSNSASAPSGFSACSYSPAAGYDPNVKYICVNPSGRFTGNNTSFALKYRTKIN